ncbi:hypothetical protein [Ginsengibacter hankyongi]|uniref:hypothetical protein n=1 Tax=Ginsengibacter hankyongi TaxID=2607284 RepID=UPI0019281372|nr:hypothetical protein [Ginsengibacter hankyongi]
MNKYSFLTSGIEVLKNNNATTKTIAEKAIYTDFTIPGKETSQVTKITSKV